MSSYSRIMAPPPRRVKGALPGALPGRGAAAMPALEEARGWSLIQAALA
jgi:hypothetical protein